MLSAVPMLSFGSLSAMIDVGLVATRASAGLPARVERQARARARPFSRAREPQAYLDGRCRSCCSMPWATSPSKGLGRTAVRTEKLQARYYCTLNVHCRDDFSNRNRRGLCKDTQTDRASER